MYLEAGPEEQDDTSDGVAAVATTAPTATVMNVDENILYSGE